MVAQEKYNHAWALIVCCAIWFSAAFENEDDVTDFVKCKIESLLANKDKLAEGILKKCIIFAS